MAIPDFQVIAIHAMTKIYLDIKMSDFEAKKNILAGFMSIHDKMYVTVENTASKLKQDKQKLYILKTCLTNYKKSVLFLIKTDFNPKINFIIKSG